MAMIANIFNYLSFFHAKNMGNPFSHLVMYNEIVVYSSNDTVP